MSDRILLNLITAAEPFLSGDVVDETQGTIALMERLEDAINEAKDALRAVGREHAISAFKEFTIAN